MSRMRRCCDHCRGTKKGSITSNTRRPCRTCSRTCPKRWSSSPIPVLYQIVDWFGDNAHISKSDDRLKVTVKVSPYAMKYWAMQYLNHVEVLSPASLRREIADDLARAADRYSGS